MHVHVHVSYRCQIEMSCTIDCVHDISVYRYCSKIVYRDITTALWALIVYILESKWEAPATNDSIIAAIAVLSFTKSYEGQENPESFQ